MKGGCALDAARPALLQCDAFYSTRRRLPACARPQNPCISRADDDPMKKYMCLICGYIYDEALGAPEEGIAPGTKWEDVPPNWTCPECGARKEDFEMIEL
jgi:rubredoxin